jgi:hypothetical protein
MNDMKLHKGHELTRHCDKYWTETKRNIDDHKSHVSDTYTGVVFGTKDKTITCLK